MDIVIELENPLPILKTDIDKIEIETSKSFEGSFRIKNLGGSTLEGTIVSNSKYIEFNPQKFLGNDMIINYFVNISEFDKKNFENSNFLIKSNGGEKNIIVNIKITPPFLLTKDNFKIYDFKDFFDYYKNNPVESRFLFSSQDFMIWLDDISYKLMDIYEHFIQDSNKERGLENFLIANGYEQKIEFKLEQSDLKIQINPFEKDLIKKSFVITKLNKAFRKTTITTKFNSDWLIVGIKNINFLDFADSDSKEIDFFINPKLINQNYVYDTIQFEEYNLNYKIEVVKKPLIKINLSKNKFDYNDTGEIIIENNTNKDIVVEVSCEDFNVKFEGKKYFISEKATIPFFIKSTAFQSAQMFLKKPPVYFANIQLKTFVDETMISKKISFGIGSF